MINWPQIFADNPDTPNRELAARLGVHPNTVVVQRSRIQRCAVPHGPPSPPRSPCSIPLSTAKTDEEEAQRPGLRAAIDGAVADFFARGGTITRCAPVGYVAHRAVPAYLEGL